MRQERVWHDYISLPPELQKQVADFITLLRARSTASRISKTAKRTKLANEPFIGMWRSRADLRDSRAWVRNVRQSEWMSRDA
jgi:hypothetical protein